MSDRKDLPTPSSTNFEARVRETLMTYLGRTGDPLDRGVTLRDLLDSGLAKLKPGRTPTSLSVGGSTLPIQPQATETEPDLTPPPTPTGFSVAAGLNNIFIEHDDPAYSQGHGHFRTRLYGKTISAGDPLPAFADAVEIAQFTGSVHSHPSNLSTTWRLWVKWESSDGVLSVSPAGGTNGLEATTGKIGNTDLGPLIVEAGNLATGAVTATKLAAEAVEATKFASGIEPVSVVTAVPTTKSTNTIYNSTDGKLYRWNGTAYVASVPTTDLTGQIEAAQIADAALTTAKFASGIEPVTIVTSLPTTKSTNAVFNTTDGKLYRWDGTAYVASVPTVDLSGTIEAAQIAAGAVDTSKLASDAITSGVFAPGYQPLGVVTNLPPALGYTGPNTVFQTSDSKIYRYDGVDFTSVVEALDIDSRGLDIKDLLGNTVFDYTGEIAPTAYVNVNSNNVLISDVAANALVPSLNYVGAFASAPTQVQLGAAWKQNSVYKNTTDGKSYVLTGTPLAWVEYLADGQLFLLVIESTNGTIFRVGGNQSTLLKARLFKNGAEVTDQTPESWFRWRRVSALPQAPPNDDATWNGLYASGYRQVSINVDSVNARATFFCDILSP